MRCTVSYPESAASVKELRAVVLSKLELHTLLQNQVKVTPCYKVNRIRTATVARRDLSKPAVRFIQVYSRQPSCLYGLRHQVSRLHARSALRDNFPKVF